MDDRREHHTNVLSRHIFPGANSMVGICMTLVGLIKLLENGSEPRQADECVAIVMPIFFSSSLLSYAAIRIAHHVKLSRRLEQTADIMFASGLAGVILIGLFFAFDWL
jgi:hypothetical protein